MKKIITIIIILLSFTGVTLAYTFGFNSSVSTNSAQIIVPDDKKNDVLAGKGIEVIRFQDKVGEETNTCYIAKSTREPEGRILYQPFISISCK